MFLLFLLLSQIILEPGLPAYIPATLPCVSTPNISANWTQINATTVLMQTSPDVKLFPVNYTLCCSCCDKLLIVPRVDKYFVYDGRIWFVGNGFSNNALLIVNSTNYGVLPVKVKVLNETHASNYAFVCGIHFDMWFAHSDKKMSFYCKPTYTALIVLACITIPITILGILYCVKVKRQPYDLQFDTL